MSGRHVDGVGLSEERVDEPRFRRHVLAEAHEKRMDEHAWEARVDTHVEARVDTHVKSPTGSDA